MIKKTLISLLFFLALCINIFADSFESNIFGQKLGPSNNNSEYVLEVKDDLEYLRKNNELIKTISRQKIDNREIVIENDIVNNCISEKHYENGLLISENIKKKSDITEIKYNYIDGSLLFCSVTENGSEPVIEYYLKDSVNGKLLGKKLFSDINLAGSDYLIENENIFFQLSDSVVLNNSFTFDEIGNIVYSNEDTQFVYSNDGFIIKETHNGIVTEYFYNTNKELIQTESVDEDRKTVCYYNNGKVEKELIYENELLKTINSFSDPVYGMVSTVVDNGRNIADVYYDLDCIRIIKIEYLN